MILFFGLLLFLSVSPSRSLIHVRVHPWPRFVLPWSNLVYHVFFFAFHFFFKMVLSIVDPLARSGWLQRSVLTHAQCALTGLRRRVPVRGFVLTLLGPSCSRFAVDLLISSVFRSSPTQVFVFFFAKKKANYQKKDINSFCKCLLDERARPYF